MLRYYLLVAVRNARRNSLYTGLSTVCLTLGLGAVLLIGLYIKNELSYETWLPGYQEIYRATPSTNTRSTSSPSELGQWLAQDYPQFTAVTRLLRNQSVISAGDAAAQEYNENVSWVDANFFTTFEFDFVAGDARNALTEPNSVVLTESLADKYFPGRSAVGELLNFDRTLPMRVTAVIKDLPPNTHLDPGLLASRHTLNSITDLQDRSPIGSYFGSKVWSSATYARLPAAESIAQIAADMDAMLDRHLPVETGRTNSDIYDIELIPIADLHLAANVPHSAGKDLRNIYSVAALGALILAAAIINYINLMTARGLKRAPEIAIRKTVGADRASLVWQFLSESMFHVVFAAVLALGLAAALLPAFGSFLLRDLSITDLWSPAALLGIAVVVLVTVLAAGTYPALILSRYSPMVLFHTARERTARISVRACLSIVQFAILTMLTISTWVIYQQARYGINESLKNIEDPIVWFGTACKNSLLQEFSQIPGVLDVSCSAHIPQFGIGWGTTATPTGLSANESLPVRYGPISEGFVELMGIELLAGRSFSRDRPGDRAPENNQWDTPQPVLINATMARALNVDTPQQAIGKLFDWGHVFKLPNEFTPQHTAEVIGVMADVQIGTVRTAIPNLVFYLQPESTQIMEIKLHNEDLPATLAALDAAWKSAGEAGPLRRQFLDETVNTQYQNIIRESQLLAIYAAVAIVIAVLGLVGLAVFVAEKRTKEIGIRKALGGTRLTIVGLLLWQFSVPVIISNLIAWPVAWLYLMDWLSGFEQHIEIPVWIFPVAGLVTLLVAMCTVFFHAFRLAGTQPIVALRYE